MTSKTIHFVISKNRLLYQRKKVDLDASVMKEYSSKEIIYISSLGECVCY
jgi:hypothetical protein